MEGDSAVTEKMYKEKVTWFERPIVSNQPYNYKLVHAQSPYDFTVRIDDPSTAAAEEQVDKLLTACLEDLKTMEKEKREGLKIAKALFYEGMPVLVKATDDQKRKTLIRGEVIRVEDNCVDVLQIDLGGVVVRVEKDKLLPVPVDLLRLPKLGVPCNLALIRPATPSGEWPEKRNYSADFSDPLGQQQITFQDYFPEKRSYEVVLEVKKRNVALKYFHDGVAQPVPVTRYPKDFKFCPVASYPNTDFSAWIGLKLIVFGVKVYKDDFDQGILKCVMQLEPEMVNGILDKIVDYLKNAPEAVKNAPFEKKAGSPCLAKFDGEFFRATVIKQEGPDQYLVEYVDYGEKQVVPVTDMLKIPEELVQLAEGAQICQITDLCMYPDFQDVDKIKELVESKDLYAILDAVDPSRFGDELLISLYIPDETFSGLDTPLGTLLGFTQRPLDVQDILQMFEIIPPSFASLFLKPMLPDPNEFFPGAQVAVINDWDSLWIQLPSAAPKIATLTLELRNFYLPSGGNSGCPEGLLQEFWKAPATGQYVAARQEDDGDETALYRGRVLEEKVEGGKAQVLVKYLDYGNFEWVEKQRVFPLHKFFAKDPLFVVECALKL